MTNVNIISIILRLLATIITAVLMWVLFWISPTASSWNPRVFDYLFTLRNTTLSHSPLYGGQVVHIDLNDTSLQKLNTYYIDRAHFSKLVDNLSLMGVTAQLYDIIFAAPSNIQNDKLLIESVKKSGSSYFGLAFKLGQKTEKNTPDSPSGSSPLIQNHWAIKTNYDDNKLLEAHGTIATFPSLAKVSKGIGFLNISQDSDGVLRRVPLLIQFGDLIYPSLSLRVVCDYLSVKQNGVILHPGKSITLRNAREPNSSKAEDIVIPIDYKGRMIVNYLGPWEAMNHYHFSDVIFASDSEDTMKLWEQELQGKIAVVADVATGSGDVGPVPTDSAYPLTGVNSNVINTILTESFLSEATPSINFIVYTFMFVVLLLLSFRSSTLTLLYGYSILIAGFVLSASGIFVFYGYILNIMTPLIFTTFILFSFLFVKAFESNRKLQKKNIALHQTRLQIIQRLGKAAEFKDNETGLHVIRMSYYSHILALASGMDKRKAEILMNAAPMHDIGKIGIPDNILKKPGKLSDEEFDTMKNHCQIGADVIGKDDSELLQLAKTIALTHHEKWNGRGYPNKVSGENIPLAGRIIAIADVFDALTSKRPYKKAWSTEDAIELLEKEAGKHFDPALVQLFVESLPEINKIKEQHMESADFH